MSNQITFCAVIIVCLALSAQASAQDTDCALADRYYGLAQDRLGTADNAEATVFLERAGAACPRFNYFQELGELRMKSVNEEDRTNFSTSSKMPGVSPSSPTMKQPFTEIPRRWISSIVRR